MTDTTTTILPDTQLPPDSDGMNGKRAEWADRALQQFQITTGTDREDALADMLCNLIHLCDRDADLGNFDAQLERAKRNYDGETSGEDAA